MYGLKVHLHLGFFHKLVGAGDMLGFFVYLPYKTCGY